VTSIQSNPWRRITLNAISDSIGVIDERKLIAAAAQSVAGTVAGAQHTDDAWMTVSRQRKTAGKLYANVPHHLLVCCGILMQLLMIVFRPNPTAVKIAARPSKAEQPRESTIKQVDVAPTSWLDMFPPLPAALQSTIVKKPIIPATAAPSTSIKSATPAPAAKIPVSAPNSKKSEQAGQQHQKTSEKPADKPSKPVQKPVNAKTESTSIPQLSRSAQPAPQSAVKLASGAGKTIISAKMMNLKIKPLTASERAAVLAQKYNSTNLIHFFAKF
jgi:hypothetical protein